MTTHERTFQLFLRVIGISAILAIVAVVMPHAWMGAIHRELGLGELSSDPIVGYLARSTSAFYVIFGGLFWVIAGDVRRYRALLTYLGVALVAFGAALLVIDLAEGLPWWWSLGEGPINALFGILILWLNSRCPAADSIPTRHGGVAKDRS
jgi:hypothetical protein